MWKKDEAPDTVSVTGRQPEKTAERKKDSASVSRSEPPRSGTAGTTANIGRSITIKGDISGNEDLHIQGSVDGSVNLVEHNVTITPEGRVKADVYGLTITVQGQVEGDLFGGEQVILHPSCRVSGNITAPRVALQDGANFRGTIDMEAKSGDYKPAVRSSPDLPSSSQPAQVVTAGDPSNSAKANGNKRK